MPLKQILFIISFFTVACSSGYAQKKWTLEECIQYAKDNNIQIKQQSLDIDDAKLVKKQAILNYFPSIGVGSDYNTTFGRVLDPTTYEFVENRVGSDVNISSQASVNVFSGMNNLHTKRRSNLNIHIAMENIEKIKNDLSLNVTKSYLELLIAEENVKIPKEISFN